MYHGYGVNLSRAQVSSLGRGATVRLKHGDLAGQDKVYLTQTQITRMNRCRAANKGCDLKLSNAQLRHHVQHGGSILDTLKSFGKTVFNEVVKPIASNVVKMALPRVQKRGEQLASDLVNRTLTRVGAGRRKRGAGVWDDIWGGIQSVGKVALPIATTVGTNLLAKRLGMGLKKKRRQVGRSFLLPGQR